MTLLFQLITIDSITDLKLKGVEEALGTIHERHLTMQAMTEMPMNSCCVPGARRLYIDTKGNMYVCERINKSPKVGNVMQGIDKIYTDVINPAIMLLMRNLM